MVKSLCRLSSQRCDKKKFDDASAALERTSALVLAGVLRGLEWPVSLAWPAGLAYAYGLPAGLAYAYGLPAGLVATPWRGLREKQAAACPHQTQSRISRADISLRSTFSMSIAACMVSVAWAKQLR
jgi:hypothetical protein